SLCVDRFTSVNDSELNVKLLIENLKNVIMKKLFISCVAESLMFLSASSTTSFSAALSQSSTLISVSDSPAFTTSVSVTLTSATSDFTVSAFIISSFCFKEMLYRLDKLHFLVCTLSFFLSISRTIYCIKITKDICVFRNRNADIILFYTHRYETFTLISEIILIKNDNTAETILSHSQASLITFSLFSVRKTVCTLNYKYSALNDF
ncbi:hypothetical protein BDDG_13231, partial [Blastomyces dermatitidis ATCC 18188]